MKGGLVSALLLLIPLVDATGPSQESISRGRALLLPPRSTAKVPTPTETRLRNGIPVLFFDDRRAPLVTFHIFIEGAGTLSDRPEYPGVAAALMATLLDTALAADNLQSRLDATGSTLGARVQPGFATIQGVSLPEHFNELFDAAKRMLRPARLPQPTFEKHMARHRSQDAALANNRLTVALLARSIFQPRSSPSVSAYESASSSLRELFVPPRVYVAVSGPLSSADVVRAVAPGLEAWRVPKPDPRPYPTLDVRPRIVLVPDDGAQRTRIVLGTATSGRLSPDAYALEVLNEVFGAGGSGRLFTDLREKKGYSYSPSSRYEPTIGASYWAASMIVDTLRTGDAVVDLLREVERMREEFVPDAELTAKKRALSAGLPLMVESREALHELHVQRVVNGLASDFWIQYPRRVQAVTAKHVRDAARKYLDASRLVIVAAGDSRTIRDAATRLGLAVELRATER